MSDFDFESVNFGIDETLSNIVRARDAMFSREWESCKWALRTGQAFLQGVLDRVENTLRQEREFRDHKPLFETPPLGKEDSINEPPHYVA